MLLGAAVLCVASCGQSHLEQKLYLRGHVWFSMTFQCHALGKFQKVPCITAMFFWGLPTLTKGRMERGLALFLKGQIEHLAAHWPQPNRIH